MRKIVLTGGPCAGKTTLTRVLAQAFPGKLTIVPEAASMLFTGGFPRSSAPVAQHATQRTLYHLQLGLEVLFPYLSPSPLAILDRGTIDGAAYWPEGPEAFFAALGTTFEKECARYDAVIYLESAGEAEYLAHWAANPQRVENWDEACRLDRITRALWSRHPNVTVIGNHHSFHLKIEEVTRYVEAALTP